MRSLVAVVLCLCSPIALTAQSTPSISKESLKFSLDNIDKAADPCTDFYLYACGNWMKNNEIPADQPRWGSFTALHESNMEVLREILEKAAIVSSKRSPNEQKIGDFYSSCMDEKAADAAGITPLKEELAHIEAIKDKQGLIDEIAHLHMI